MLTIYMRRSPSPLPMAVPIGIKTNPLAYAYPTSQQPFTLAAPPARHPKQSCEQQQQQLQFQQDKPSSFHHHEESQFQPPPPEPRLQRPTCLYDSLKNAFCLSCPPSGLNFSSAVAAKQLPLEQGEVSNISSFSFTLAPEGW